MTAIVDAFFSPTPAAAVRLAAAASAGERWAALAEIASKLVAGAPLTLGKLAANTPLRKHWVALAEPTLPATKARGVAPAAARAIAAVNLLALAEANDRRFDRALRGARKLAGWDAAIEQRIVASLHGRLGKQHENAFGATPPAKLAAACDAGDLRALAAVLATWQPPVDVRSWYALCQLAGRVPERALGQRATATAYLALAAPLFRANQTWSQRWKGGISADRLATTYRATLLAALTARDAALVDAITAQAVRDRKHVAGALRGVAPKLAAGGHAAAADKLRAALGARV